MSKKRANKKSGKEGKSDCPNTPDKEQKELPAKSQSVNQNNAVEGESKSEKTKWMIGGVFFGVSGSIMASYLSELANEWKEPCKLIYNIFASLLFLLIADLFLRNNKLLEKILNRISIASIILFFIICIYFCVSYATGNNTCGIREFLKCFNL